jgi:sulfonate transport system ATP-binding protein
MTAATITALRSVETVPVARAARSTGPAAFAFRNVRKSFGDKQVLDGIDLAVGAGQFLAIIGKSGCGKSTLLRLLAGLDRPTAGTLDHGGGRTDHSLTRIMFQEPRLLPWARVVDNVAVGLTGIAKGAEAKERALDLLAEVGLKDRASEWPSVLSGGQRQRVALARALVGHPQILALDEPLGALDAITRRQMHGWLQEVLVGQGRTALLVTHDVEEALILADEVQVMSPRPGRIIARVDSPWARPRLPGIVTEPDFVARKAELLAALDA